MTPRFESYRLSRQAEADLEDIYIYTAERWSVAQAARYTGELRDAIIGLVNGARMAGA